nr:hypothetical protein [Pseudonocardia sp. N23]
MTQSLRHQRDVDAGREEHARLPVSQVVETHRAQTRRHGQLAEPLRHGVERERVAVLAGEHQAVVDVRGAPREALGVLGEPVREQHADDATVQVDAAGLPAAGLRLAERVALVTLAARRARGRGVDLDELLADDDDAPLQVDVGPAESTCLTAAHPGGGDEFEEGRQPVPGDGVEELAELGRLPRLDLVALDLGELDALGGVERDELLTPRRRQRTAQGAVHSANAHRPRSHGPQHRADVQGADVAQPQVAELRGQVVADVGAVGALRRGTQLAHGHLHVDPFSQVRAERHPVVVGVGAVADRLDDVAHRQLGLGCRPEAAALLLPALPVRPASEVDDVVPGPVVLLAGQALAGGVADDRAAAALVQTPPHSVTSSAGSPRIDDIMRA